tara:strand:- start:265 stop:465 length:201 start_codon:yes stop_codon:yes gene_type:complete
MANSDKRIIYTDENGDVCVVVPSDDCGLTVEQIKTKDVPDGIISYIIDKSDVPTDRSFRNAWTYTP